MEDIINSELGYFIKDMYEYVNEVWDDFEGYLKDLDYTDNDIKRNMMQFEKLFN